MAASAMCVMADATASKSGKQVNDDDENLRLKAWIDPESISGILTFILLVVFFYIYLVCTI